MSISLFLLIAQAPAINPANTLPVITEQCEYDNSVLSMGYEAFDQSSNESWRTLSEKPGCETKAAELLKKYRRKYEQIIPLLYWHEAQVRAEIGETNEAIALMEDAKRRGRDLTGWNPYVDATVAFLRNDKANLVAARRRLANWPKPEGWPTDANWPANLDVVDGLIACFGKSYQVAYSLSCRPVQSTTPTD